MEKFISVQDIVLCMFRNPEALDSCFKRCSDTHRRTALLKNNLQLHTVLQALRRKEIYTECVSVGLPYVQRISIARHCSPEPLNFEAGFFSATASPLRIAKTYKHFVLSFQMEVAVNVDSLSLRTTANCFDNPYFCHCGPEPLSL